MVDAPAGVVAVLIRVATELSGYQWSEIWRSKLGDLVRDTHTSGTTRPLECSPPIPSSEA